MRVALTTNTLNVGGAEKQRVLLANGLALRGYDVSLVVLQEIGPLAERLSPAVQLVRARATTVGFSHRFDVLVTGMTNTEASFAAVSRVRSRLRARWLAVSHSWPPAKGHLYGSRVRALTRLADAIGVLTPTHGEALCASDRMCQKVVVLPNGTDLLPALESTRARSQVTRLGFIGRLEPVKGVDRLLTAMASLPPDPPWSLTLYGAGSQRTALNELAQDVGVAATWMGVTNEVPRVLEELDILIIPSRSEALPMVALEAMAAGCVVAAAPVGALPELLEDGSGYVLGADHHQWADQLARLIGDADLRMRMSTAARRVASRWSTEAMTDAYEGLFRSWAGVGAAG